MVSFRMTFCLLFAFGLMHSCQQALASDTLPWTTLTHENFGSEPVRFGMFGSSIINFVSSMGLAGRSNTIDVETGDIQSLSAYISGIDTGASQSSSSAWVLALDTMGNMVASVIDENLKVTKGFFAENTGMFYGDEIVMLSDKKAVVRTASQWLIGIDADSDKALTLVSSQSVPYMTAISESTFAAVYDGPNGFLYAEIDSLSSTPDFYALPKNFTPKKMISLSGSAYVLGVSDSKGQVYVMKPDKETQTMIQTVIPTPVEIDQNTDLLSCNGSLLLVIENYFWSFSPELELNWAQKMTTLAKKATLSSPQLLCSDQSRVYVTYQLANGVTQVVNFGELEADQTPSGSTNTAFFFSKVERETLSPIQFPMPQFGDVESLQISTNSVPIQIKTFTAYETEKLGSLVSGDFPVPFLQGEMPVGILSDSGEATATIPSDLLTVPGAKYQGSSSPLGQVTVSENEVTFKVAGGAKTVIATVYFTALYEKSGIMIEIDIPWFIHESASAADLSGSYVCPGPLKDAKCDQQLIVNDMAYLGDGAVSVIGSTATGESIQAVLQSGTASAVSLPNTLSSLNAIDPFAPHGVLATGESSFSLFYVATNNATKEPEASFDGVPLSQECEHAFFAPNSINCFNANTNTMTSIRKFPLTLVATVTLEESCNLTNSFVSKNGDVYFLCQSSEANSESTQSQSGALVVRWNDKLKTFDHAVSAAVQIGSLDGALIVDDQENVWVAYHSSKGYQLQLVVFEFRSGKLVSNAQYYVGDFGSPVTNMSLLNEETMLISWLNGSWESGVMALNPKTMAASISHMQVNQECGMIGTAQGPLVNVRCATYGINSISGFESLPTGAKTKTGGPIEWATWGTTTEVVANSTVKTSAFSPSANAESDLWRSLLHPQNIVAETFDIVVSSTLYQVSTSNVDSSNSFLA